MISWKISNLFVEGELITSVKYSVCASDETNTIETEGNCTFTDPVLSTPFKEVKEEQVLNWVKKELTEEQQNSIELNLQKQLEALKIQEPVKAPWLKTTFKPTL